MIFGLGRLALFGFIGAAIVATFVASHSRSLSWCKSGTCLSTSAMATPTAERTAKKTFPAITPFADDKRFSSKQPWGIRYFIYVTNTWADERERAARKRSMFEPGMPADSLIEIFEPSYFFKSQYSSDSSDNGIRGDGLSVLVIEFAPDGVVITRNIFDRPLVGQVDQSVVSIVGVGPQALPRLKLAERTTAPPGTDSMWSPAMCVEGNVRPTSPRLTRIISTVRYSILRALTGLLAAENGPFSFIKKPGHISILQATNRLEQIRMIPVGPWLRLPVGLASKTLTNPLSDGTNTLIIVYMTVQMATLRV